MTVSTDPNFLKRGRSEAESVEPGTFCLPTQLTARPKRLTFCTGIQALHRSLRRQTSNTDICQSELSPVSLFHFLLQAHYNHAFWGTESSLTGKPKANSSLSYLITEKSDDNLGSLG